MLPARDLGVGCGCRGGCLPRHAGCGIRSIHFSVFIYSATRSTDPKRRSMSVRGSLLAILDQGPCYGYQLRAEFDRRTGSVWPLNVGQIYNTLDRLEREDLVAKGEIDEEGHVYWEITDAGRAAAREWLAEPLDRVQGGRDELAVKIA